MFFPSSLLLAAVIGTVLPTVRSASAEEPFDPDRLEREILAADLTDPIQLKVAPDGDVYLIERAGRLRRYSPTDRIAHAAGSLPTAVGGEYGLIGLELDPGFARNRWIYLMYSPAGDQGRLMRLSRFTLKDAVIDPTSETVILSYPIRGTGHQGGALQFDAEGNLWIGVGDDARAAVTPATDERPGSEIFNALATSANTQDLRGKILRIRPQPDGRYTIPAGNLFADPADGRPEIYVMGCRNPYRFYYDSAGGTLYWAEIGSNTEERFGTGGYDEISRTTVPGNSGWPLFIGPNTAYRRYDAATKTVGEPYSPERPVNESRLNTGMKILPPPIPALIWYGSEDSPEFPALGNGGRSAMAGPLYRYDPALDSPVKLPAVFDRQLFIYEWCRTWIKTVAFDDRGGLAGISSFMPRLNFRRPIDLSFGPDGALYTLEYGEKWMGNTDGMLSRIVYRRGNRPPLAVPKADVVAGVAPLEVRFSAGGSSDPDGDALTYDWFFGEQGAAAQGESVRYTYAGKGVRTAALVVTDAHGLSHRATLTIAVGNAPPEIRVTKPAHGSFFDWGQSVPYTISVSDPENGSTERGTIAADDVRINWRYRDEMASEASAGPQIGFEGGAAIMRRSTCLSCHQLTGSSVGPAFLTIADRYRGEAGAAERLAAKIRDGGSGAWGDVAMPAHPQHPADELAAMVDYILTQRPPENGEPIRGLAGRLVTLPGPRNAMHEKNAGGRYVLTVAYRDRGADGAAPLTTEAQVMVHARRTRAALFHASEQVTVMEVSTLRRDRRICVQMAAGSHLVFRSMNLHGITAIACEVSAGAGHGGTLEFRADGLDGPVIARVAIPSTGQWENWQTVTAPVNDPGGVRDLYVVAVPAPGYENRRFNLDVLEFKPAARE